MKRILITGASGFIGGFLVEKALDRGWEVTAAVRPTSDRTWLKDARIRFLELDFRNESKLIEKLSDADRFDFIIHNAGSTKERNREGYFINNFEGTKRFAEALRSTGRVPDKFLYMSSLAAIGPAKFDKKIEPGKAPEPVTFYGESKLASEQYLATLPDFPWVAVQPTAVFGPREKEFYLAVKLAYRGWAFHIGTKPQQLSFIYVKDLADMMLAALERGRTGKKYLATDGKAYSGVDVGKAVENVSGRRAIQVRVPLPMVHVVASVAEIIGNIRGKIPLLNREKLSELTAESWLCDMSETFDDLQFKPRYDLYKGMQETVQWYKNNHWL